MGKVILSDEEAQEKAVEEVREKMKVLEESIKKNSLQRTFRPVVYQRTISTQ